MCMTEDISFNNDQSIKINSDNVSALIPFDISKLWKDGFYSLIPIDYFENIKYSVIEVYWIKLNQKGI